MLQCYELYASLRKIANIQSVLVSHLNDMKKKIDKIVFELILNFNLLIFILSYFTINLEGGVFIVHFSHLLRLFRSFVNYTKLIQICKNGIKIKTEAKQAADNRNGRQYKQMRID